MEPHPRAAAGAHGLRPLGLPRPVQVRVDSLGEPTEVVRRGRSLRVDQVEEVWRIAEAWWREAPLDRTYYRLALADGRTLTVFRDGRDGEWFEQHYSAAC